MVSVLALPVILRCMMFSTDYAETNTFFLGNSTDVTSQMSVQTDRPCTTSTQELQPSETQPSETLSVVAKKKSKYWNYV